MRVPTSSGGKEINIQPRYFWWFILAMTFVCAVIAIEFSSLSFAVKMIILSGTVFLIGTLALAPFMD